MKKKIISNNVFIDLDYGEPLFNPELKKISNSETKVTGYIFGKAKRISKVYLTDYIMKENSSNVWIYRGPIVKVSDVEVKILMKKLDEVLK